MDRNAAIGTVLIFAILMIWMWWLSPAPQTELAPQDDPVVDTQAVVRELEVQPELQERREQVPQVDTTLAGVGEGEERSIVVDTDLYQAVFSTRGGTLRSFRLKEYRKFDQSTPVQLVDTTRAGALGLAFTTPTNHHVDSRSFLFSADTEADTIRVGDEAQTLTFETAVGSGTLRQVYTFQPEEYEVGLQVAMDNATSFQTSEGYELVWYGGLPFTEGDVDEESARAGAYVRSGGEVEEITLQKSPEETRRFSGDISWTAVRNKYFAAVLIPEGNTRGAEVDGERFGEGQQAQTLFEDYTARLLMAPPTSDVQSFRLYIGPLEYFRLASYRLGLYDMVDYGWNMFEWMTRPLAKFIFIPAFTFLSNFIPNYGIIIIIIAIALKFILYPLTKSSYTSMARMRELQPKMEAIKEKFADNPQKQQEAMMKMYKETGVNPIGGCLPMLMQYPIIIALWQFLPQAIEIRQQGFLWANDLSAPDVILSLPFTIPFYGNFVAGFTLLMGISMVVQMKVQMTPQTNAQAKIFTYVFPVMIFVIFNRLAAGLSLYYLVYNVVTALQQKWINSKIESVSEEPGAKATPAKTDGRKVGTKSERRKNRAVRT